MQVTTETVALDVPREEAFAYLAELRNVPSWATEFIREFELDGEVARIRTEGGPATMRIQADEKAGTIDFVVDMNGDEGVFPSRVVALPGGGSAYAFTVAQAPGQPDEAFAAALGSLRRELENVRQALR